MSVVVETTLGDITIDLFVKQRPRACLNFLKLCKMKYFNYNLFHTISRGFIAQTGDPTGTRNGGESIFGVLEGPLKRYFEAEKNPRIKHTTTGLVSFVGENQMIGSQFFITLGSDLTYLDEQHCVFGEVMEGMDVLELLNETICDQDNRPYQDIRITHTVVLDDPFPDPEYLKAPSRSPSPSAERMQGGRIAPDEDIDEVEGKTAEEVDEILAEKEAKARATILEMVGDIPDADMAPPENVLFVCKLNPITTDDDLEIIFSRFGKIKSCEVIRDKKTGDSLQYAFVEFEDRKSCEEAYFKMDNVLIDDRRIHVDFSQSVAKVKWHGKGRGVTTYDSRGRRADDTTNDIGKGKYKRSNGDHKRRHSSERNIINESERSHNYDRRKRSRSRETRQSRERRFKSRSRSRSRSHSHSRSKEKRHRSHSKDRRYNYYFKTIEEKRKGRREYSDEKSSHSYRADYYKQKSERYNRKVDSRNYKSDRKRGDRSSDEDRRSAKHGHRKEPKGNAAKYESTEESSDATEEDVREKKKRKHKNEGDKKQRKRSKQKKRESSDDS